MYSENLKTEWKSFKEISIVEAGSTPTCYLYAKTKRGNIYPVYGFDKNIVTIVQSTRQNATREIKDIIREIKLDKIVFMIKKS